MGNANTGKIDGDWLRLALDALGETQTSAALKLGRGRGYFTKHISGGPYLNAESLRELALLFPSLNVRYILTGQGSPLLTHPQP